ncbi:MAG: hypothetical protein RBS48_05845 [Ignavibacteriaceae bacterium]|jgi:hypothetical protein|nr:hypothetical protein [Ignavibacteriaceae bacterium]
MKIDELEIMINEFLDGELDKSKEGFLFTQLSLDENFREYFKKHTSLRNEFQNLNEEYPSSLDSEILNSLIKIKPSKEVYSFQNNVAKYSGFLVAVILLILSIFYINESRINSIQLERTIKQVENQEQMIKLLINSIPAAEIKSAQEGTIIITSNKL